MLIIFLIISILSISFIYGDLFSELGFESESNKITQDIYFRKGGSVGMQLLTTPYIKSINTTGIDENLNRTDTYLGNNTWQTTKCHLDYDKYKDTCIKGNCLDEYPMKNGTLDLLNNECDTYIWSAPFNEVIKEGLESENIIPLNPQGNMTILQEYTNCQHRYCTTDIKIDVSSGEFGTYLNSMKADYECDVESSLLTSEPYTLEENVTIYHCTKTMNVTEDWGSDNFTYEVCASGIDYNMTCPQDALCDNRTVCNEWNETDMDWTCLDSTNYTYYNHNLPYLALRNITKPRTNQDGVFIVINDTMNFTLITIMKNEGETCKYNLSINSSHPQTREYQNTTILDPFVISGNSNWNDPDGNNCTETDVTGFKRLTTNDTCQELPNNQGLNPFNPSGINMTGNVLLMHFNNDSSIPECTIRNQADCVYDFSGSGNNGTLGNATVGTDPTFTSSGKLNGAFDFDGNFINVGDGANLEGLSTASGFAWIKRDIIGVNHQIFGDRNTTDIAWQLFVQGSDDTIRLRIDTAGGFTLLDTSATIDVNWHHVGWTYNGSKMRIYVNGAEDNSVEHSNPGAIQILNTDFIIGSSIPSTYFNGTIDEVAIWNRSLSATEIKAMYDLQKGKYPSIGEYTDNITDAGTISVFNNFSWVTEVNYSELPNDQIVESSPYFLRGTNMTGNILLMHLNVDETPQTDSSGNGNTGVVSGATFTSSGKLNGAFDFDGVNDLINISGTSYLNGSTEITECAWINIENYTVFGGVIVHRESRPDNRDSVMLLDGSAPFDPGLLFSIQDNGTGQCLVRGTGNDLTNKNQWYHVCGTWDNAGSGSCATYIDGVLIATSTGANGTFFQNANILVGRDLDGPRYFNGTIDEVSIWNRSLSETEILDIYKRGVIRLNMTVRSCNDAACDTETFIDINDTSPQLNINTTYGIANNRYFQWRARFETDGNVTGQLYNVTIGYSSVVGVDNNPVTTLNFPIDNFFNDTSAIDNITFNCSATDDQQLANITLYITNPSNTSFAFNQTTNITGTSNSTTWNNTLTTGTYTWNCLTFDNASQFDWGVNRTIFMNFSDITAPTITVLTPQNNSNTTSQGFGNEINVSINENGNCSFNDTKWTQISGNTTFFHFENNTVLAEQKHDITISCWDNQPTPNNGSQLLSFIIDDTPPNIFTPPNAIIERDVQNLNEQINCTDALLQIDNFSTNYTTTFSINNSGGLVNISKLAIVRNFTIIISCNDLVGNTNSTPYNVEVTDTTPPVVNATFPQEGITWGQNAITYNVTINEDASSCDYSLDHAANQSMLEQTPTFYQASDSIADGFHNITTCCTDLAGLIGCYKLRNFTINTRSPAVPLFEPIPFQNFTSNQGILLIGAGETSFNPIDNCSSYHNETGAWIINQTNSSITSGANITFNTSFETVEGIILWNIECVNIFGGSTFNETNRTFTIDQVAPRITSPANATLIVNVNSLNVNFIATDFSTLDNWSINDTTNFFINASGNLINKTLLTIRTYIINVSINDTPFNNINWTLYQVNVTPDLEAPKIDIVSPTNNTNSTNTGLNVLYQVSDNIAVDTCWLNNNSNPTNISLPGCANITTVTWSEGQHNLIVYVNDTTGNENFSMITFNIDSISPTISILTPPNNTNTTDNTLDINYTVFDTNLDICRYNDNGGADNLLSGCINISTTWDDGIHNLNITANDTFGNYNSTFVTFTIDSEAPKIDIVSPTNNTNTNDTGINVLYQVSDIVGIDKCWYNNNSNPTNISLPSCANITTVTWSEGQHNVTVYVNDTIGNENSSRITFNIDTIAPTISILTPMNDTACANNTLDVNYTVFDLNLDTCWYIDNAGADIPLAGCINITAKVWDEGQHNVTVTSNDTAGNQNSSSVTFIIDTVAPTINFTNPTTSNGTNVQTFIEANVTASDLSGTDIINYTIWNSTFDIVFTNSSNSSPFFNNVSLDFGTYYINATVNDTCGTLNSTETIIIILSSDLTNPQVVNMSSIPGPTTMVVNCTATDNIGVVNFSISINGTNEDSGNQSICEYTFTGLDPETDYNITFNAYDLVGNKGTNNSINTTLVLPNASLGIIPQKSFDLKKIHSIFNIYNFTVTDPSDNPISCKADANGFLTCAGDITGVTAGYGLEGGGTVNGINISLNSSLMNEIYVNQDTDNMTGDLNVNGIITGNTIGNHTTILEGDGRDISNIGLNNETDVTRFATIGEVSGIGKGQGVSIIDATGDKPRIMFANNQFHNNSHTLGITAEAGAFGETILIRLLGDVTGDGTFPLDTSNYTEGCRLHLDINGNMNCSIRSTGSHIHMGFATKINAVTGIIEVKPDGYVHDIQGTTDVNVSIGGYGISFMNYTRNIIGSMNMIEKAFSWFGDMFIQGNLTQTNGTAMINMIYGELSLNGTATIRADSFLNLTGLIGGGNITSIQEIDGDTLNITEVTGTPGFNVTFNYTGIVGNPARVEFIGYYDGSAGHDVDIKIFNYSSGIYVDINGVVGDIPDSSTSEILSFMIEGNRSDFISGGEVSLQIYHGDPGNANHDLFINILTITPAQTDLSNIGQYVHIKDLVSEYSNGVTINASNGTMEINVAGVYDIDIDASFIGESDSLIICDLFLGESDRDKIRIIRKMGSSGDVGSAAGGGYLRFTNGDVLSLRCLSEVANAFVSFTNLDFRIKRVGD